jgi:hypothetical protein
MNLETAGCVVLSVVAICLCVGFINKQIAEQETAKAAAAAGLVQQVVYQPMYPPFTIWVKPPAAPLVEGTK